MVNEDPKCVSEPLRLCWLNNPAGNVLAAPAGKILFYGVLAKIQDFFLQRPWEKKNLLRPQKETNAGAMSSSVFCLLGWCQAGICSASFSCCCLCVMIKVALETRTFASALFLFLCQTSPENKRRRKHRTYLWGRKD